MKHKIEQLLPKAIETLTEVGIAVENKVAKQFKGYFASFGAAIVQSGLLPAAVFFSKKGGAEESREKITEAILRLLQKQGIAAQETALWEFIQKNPSAYSRITHEVLAASSALKLALRVFHPSENEETV